jgi:transcriptional regulator with XRE-family HTH domain
MTETRTFLAQQLSDARRKRGWTLKQVAARAGKQIARISEIESGAFNTKIDSLGEVGAALGMSLVFVPTSKLDAALALSDDGKTRDPVPREWRSAHDDLFIDDRDIEDEDGDADADR